MAYPLFLAKLFIRTGMARFLPGVRGLMNGGVPFLRYYSDRMLSAPVVDLLEAAPYLDPPGREVLDLSQGTPTFDLVASGSTKLSVDRRGFPPPWGLPELRQAIAENLEAEQRVTVHPADEVFITHGVTGALSAALDTLINAGDRVVLFDPCSPLYPLLLKQRRARIRRLPCWVENGRLRFKVDDLIQAMKRAKLIVINSPHNPTGGVLAAEDLDQIAWWSQRRDVLIFSDEVFERYRYEGDRRSIAAIPSARKRTLVASSISKSHALAAARVGWLAGYRHLVRPCAMMASLQTPFVPTLCQQIALAAFRQGNETFQSIKNEFVSKRQYAFERLQACDLKPSWPGGGFFIWVSVRDLGMSGKAFSQGLLQSQNVLVWPGELFGQGGYGHIRISYAAEDGRLREGLSRLCDFIRNLQPPLEMKNTVEMLGHTPAEVAG